MASHKITCSCVPGSRRRPGSPAVSCGPLCLWPLCNRTRPYSSSSVTVHGAAMSTRTTRFEIPATSYCLTALRRPMFVVITLHSTSLHQGLHTAVGLVRAAKQVPELLGLTGSIEAFLIERPTSATHMRSLVRSGTSQPLHFETIPFLAAV